MTKERYLIVITTGGTGGHMFPASSFADAIVKKGHRIALITDKRGAEFKGTFSSHPIHTIPAASPSGNIFKRFWGIFNLGIGVVKSFFILGRLKPKIIVAFGGYASAPTVIAALFRRIPVVIHEQNAILGRANRFSAKFAKLLALSFENTKRLPKKIRTEFVGMPIRGNIKAVAQSEYPELDSDNEFNILVFGGSQGAKIFSVVTPYGMSFLDDKFKKRINIDQQCRREEIDEVRKIYGKAEIKYKVAPFFDNMSELIKKSHLLICRGGSSTIAEATAIGRPMIIIPLKISRDGDQMENAKIVQETGAGWIINEDDFNPAELKRILEYLMQNPMFLKEAAYNASRMGIIDADERLADIVLKECEKGK